MILPQMPAEYWAEQTRVALRDQEPVKSLGLAKKAMLFDPQNPTLYFYEGEAYRNLAFRVLHRSSLETTYFKKSAGILSARSGHLSRR